MAGADSIWDDPNATTSETYYEDTFGYALDQYEWPEFLDADTPTPAPSGDQE